MGPATGSKRTEGKGLFLLFPGNKVNVGCLLTEVSRLRATSTATPTCAPHTRRCPRPARAAALTRRARSRRSKPNCKRSRARRSPTPRGSLGRGWWCWLAGAERAARTQPPRALGGNRGGAGERKPYTVVVEEATAAEAVAENAAAEKVAAVKAAAEKVAAVEKAAVEKAAAEKAAVEKAAAEKVAAEKVAAAFATVAEKPASPINSWL
eukprot:scaffold129219_cov66-Phaeocystis_antarctica.AAC.5